jgi:hypothetical protein
MQKTNVGRFARLAASAPRHSVSAETIQSAIGPDLKDVVIEPSVTVIGTFNKDDPAREAFESARASVRNGRAQLLGQTVMILLPASEDAARKHWFEQLESRGASVYVETESPQGIFAIQCLAPTEQAAQRIENELENLHGEHLIRALGPDPSRARGAARAASHRARNVRASARRRGGITGLGSSSRFPSRPPAPGGRATTKSSRS